MIDLFREFLHAFLHDKLAAKRWIRGGLTAAAAIGGQLVVDPSWSTWTLRQWFFHLTPAIFAFAAGSIQSSAQKKPELTVVSSIDGKQS